MASNVEVVERVRNLEAELEKARRVARRTLRQTRKALNLTLHQVAKPVRVSHVTVWNLETGENWRTRTAAKIARLYDKLAA